VWRDNETGNGAGAVLGVVRQITRRAVAALAIVVVGLLALGAVPSYLGSGPAYHLTVTPVDGAADVEADAGPDGDATAAAAVNVTELSPRRYPYLTEAFQAADNRSSGYQRGRFGLKESFSHSPFDELEGLRARQPNASVADGAGVRVIREGRPYVVRVVQAGAGG
jgi:hypothetical protein